MSFKCNFSQFPLSLPNNKNVFLKHIYFISLIFNNDKILFLPNNLLNQKYKGEI